MDQKRISTTKDIGLLRQLFKDKQLVLDPEYQRDSVWPPSAKAYLIDTILQDKPIPLLFFQKGRDLQSGKNVYSVIDGQQRLRAIFDFLDDKFRLTQSDKKSKYAGKRFSALLPDLKDRILSYDLTIEEIAGYGARDIEDMFIRMNKYVVKLSKQELRNAKAKGAFHEFVKKLGRLPFWSKHLVFSKMQIKRMRNVEFCAELAILLEEGPQDKKSAVDLYYQKYQKDFSPARSIQRRLLKILSWIEKTLPTLAETTYRKPVDLYALVAAVDEAPRLPAAGDKITRERLLAFNASLEGGSPADERVNRYLIASSRQTDNLAPRTTRIEILKKILAGKL